MVSGFVGWVEFYEAHHALPRQRLVGRAERGPPYDLGSVAPGRESRASRGRAQLAPVPETGPEGQAGQTPVDPCGGVKRAILPGGQGSRQTAGERADKA